MNVFWLRSADMYCVFSVSQKMQYVMFMFFFQLIFDVIILIDFLTALLLIYVLSIGNQVSQARGSHIYLKISNS